MTLTGLWYGDLSGCEATDRDGIESLSKRYCIINTILI